MTVTTPPITVLDISDRNDITVSLLKNYKIMVIYKLLKPVDDLYSGNYDGSKIVL